MVVGGRDITANRMEYIDSMDSLNVLSALDKKKITPLSFYNDSTLLVNFKELKHKRIIGLGECTHGSSSIRTSCYQFIKNLIVNHNCKLVLLEKQVDVTLTWDLYVQGKIGLEYQSQIEADNKASFDGNKDLIEFLNWLRAYNEKIDNKVHLLGMDNPRDAQLYLFEFYLTLLGKDKGKYYLEKLVAGKYREVVEYAQRDPALFNLLGKQNFEYNLYVLNNEMLFDRNADFAGTVRDADMARRVSKFMEIFLLKDEKCVIYAHSGHLSKMDAGYIYLVKDLPLGYHLNRKFGALYFSVSFQIGQGSYTEDECSMIGRRVVENLRKPMAYSFEDAALSTGVPYFYYQSKFLGDALVQKYYMPRISRYSNLFEFSPLKKSFDAYVFVRNSEPVEAGEEFPAFYYHDYMYYKREKMMNFGKPLRKTRI